MAETLTYDKLFAGQVQPVVTEAITVVSGAGTLARGTVLGRITASGKMEAVDSGNATGSEDPYAVLADDVDATSGDVVANAYMTGEFNEAALVFGGTDDADTHRVAMRKIGLFLKTTIAVPS